MRFVMCCLAAFLSLPLLAQQKGGPSAAKAPIPELTAEGYRDLIVNTADAVTLAKYISPGTRVEYFNGRQRDCISDVHLYRVSGPGRRQSTQGVGRCACS